jgi:hypothetical protein
MKKLITIHLLGLLISNGLNAQQIVGLEYFIDTDPGFGSGIELALTPDSNLTLDALISIQTYNPGVHYLYLRSISTEGRWSHTQWFPFEILPNNPSENVIYAEYFIDDNDPGFGQAEPIPIMNAFQNGELTLNIPSSVTDSLVTGIHYLFTRTMDNTFHWSLTSKSMFEVVGETSENTLIGFEYFFLQGEDPGVGNATFIEFTPYSANNAFEISIPNSALNLDADTICIRTKDITQSFSHTSCSALNLEVVYFVTGSIGSCNQTVCSGEIPTPCSVVTEAESFVDVSYQWYCQNGIHSPAGTTTGWTAIDGATDLTFVPNAVSQTVTYACYTTSGIYGAWMNGAMQITVQSNPTPSIILTGGAGSLCDGTSISLTANGTNLGASPTYMWYVNNVLVPDTSNVFSTNASIDLSEISVSATSSLECAIPQSAEASATFSVLPNVVPGISIVASTTDVCSGSEVTFNSTATNIEVSDDFIWYVNGEPQNENSSTLILGNLSENTEVYVTIQTSLCAVNPMAESDTIDIIVTQTLTPSIAIDALDVDACEGDVLLFNAIGFNLGDNPIFEWFVDGNPIDTNNGELNLATINGMQMVSVSATSTLECVTNDNVSTEVEINVSEPVVPIVEVVASDVSVCLGESVIFTANAENEGTQPTYQWYVGGAEQSDNGQTFTIDNIASEINVFCVVTTSQCSLNPTDSSEVIVVSAVLPPSEPTISQSGTSLSCSVTDASSYQWYLNGVPFSDCTSPDCVIDAQNNGAWTVIVFNADGCSSESIVFDSNVSIDESSWPQMAICYPNPMHNQLNIDILNSESFYVISEMTGKVISQGKLFKGLNQLSTELWSTGMYSLEITNSLQHQNIKVIKQ